MARAVGFRLTGIANSPATEVGDIECLARPDLELRLHHRIPSDAGGGSMCISSPLEVTTDGGRETGIHAASGAAGPTDGI